MSFGKLLKKTVKEKKLTYKEISKKCYAQGIEINEKYISQIANSQKPAPSEEKIRAIARALDTNEQLFILESYIDKAPKEILNIFNNIRDMCSLFALSKVKNIFSKQDYDKIETNLQEETLSEFLVEFLDPIQLDYKSNKNFVINSEGLDFSVNTDDVPIYTVSDDLMSPMLEKGDSITLSMKDKYVDGEILAVKIYGANEIIYRIVHFKGDYIELTNLKNNNGCKAFDRNDVQIIGKVVKLIREF